MHTDDGVGPYIARNFHADQWLAVDCGTTPENFTGLVRKHKPEYLVIVDAADMNLPAGCFRRIGPDMICDVSFSTHTLPLSAMIDYLKGAVAKEIIFIAIQPADLSEGETLSPPVQYAADRVINLLHTGEVFNMQP